VTRIGYRGYNPSRDENEPGIVAALERAGASVVRLDLPCDLLVGFRGWNLLLEVKLHAGKGVHVGRTRLNDQQCSFWAMWRGEAALVVTTPAEAIEALQSRSRIAPRHLGATIELEDDAG